MKEEIFISENINQWEQLELTLKTLTSKGLVKLQNHEIDNFLSNYHSVCGHLSYSRTYFGNTSTTLYLNTLVASSHSYIYSTRTSKLKKIFCFFIFDFPLLLIKNYKSFIVATLLFALGCIGSFVVTMMSTDNAIVFLPSSVIEKDFSTDTGVRDVNNLISSGNILTNNIKVGFLAFSLGLSLGIGTIFILISNGYPLGTLAALAYKSNGSLVFWSLILPHGVIELFAIFVCGAAGLIIGYSIISPGEYTRKDSIIIQGKKAVILVLGTVPLFFVAGLIEGFVTPSALLPEFKLIFAMITFVLLILYITIPYVYSKRSNKGISKK